MTDQTQKRTYRMKRRAELEDETRRRITESAVALHGTVGPARTSISALAEHAGVRRSTVYRHFPDEVALFKACTAHWSASNPVPDMGEWAGIEDPDERLRAALGALYPFYRRTAPMLENLLRDEPTTPVVQENFAPYHQYLAAARDALMRGRRARGARRDELAAALGHALAFATWRSLALDEGLDDEQVAGLMCRLVAG